VGDTIASALNIHDAAIDATLELRKADNRSRGIITVRLDSIDTSAAGAIAVGNAMQDAVLGGVDHSAAALDSSALQVLDGGAAAVGSATNFLHSLSNVVSKLDLFVQIVDKTAKVSISRELMTCQFMATSAGPSIRHFRLASDIVALSGHFYFRFHLAVGSPDECFQAVKGQLDRDAQLMGLVKAMEDVYSFVEASDSFQDKVHVLQRTIDRILKQTVECVIFIREYTGHGFGGELNILMSRMHHFRQALQGDL
jgi:hypothetical protein